MLPIICWHLMAAAPPLPAPVRLRCENAASPVLGVLADTADPAYGAPPRLSWSVPAALGTGLHVAAYEIRVTTSTGALVWGSGRVNQTKMQARYGGSQTPLQTYDWRVRYWADDLLGVNPSTVSEWSSEQALWQTAPSRAAWQKAENSVVGMRRSEPRIGALV